MLAALLLVGAGCDATGDRLDVDPLDALTPSQRQVVAIAEDHLDTEAELSLDGGDELRFVRLDDGPGVSHVAFGHEVLDHLVLGSEIVVHVLADETVQGVTDSLTSARPTGSAEPGVAVEEAEDTAIKSFDREAETVGRSELVWHETGADLQLIWLVQVTLEDPPESWEIRVDARTGEIIRSSELTTDQAADACTVPAPPSACVFVPDPISAAAGEPVTPVDADRFLEGVELQGLDDPASGRLVGEYVNTESPGTPEIGPPQTDGTWATGRGQAGFEAAMVYWWIDRAQRHLQELGFTEVRNGPLVVYPVDRSFLDNAFYDNVNQRLEFGVSSSTGISVAEDAQIILHEYGHAVLDEQAPGLMSGVGGAIGAYHEGFGDLFSHLVTLSDRPGTGEYADGCWGAWGFGSCVRRLDTDNASPDDLLYEGHFDAQIYTGAVYDVLVGLLANQGLTPDDCTDATVCDEVRDRVLSTLLTSNGYLGDYVTFDDLAQNFLLANDALYDGADDDLIATSFSAHGIDPGGTPAGAVAVNLELYHENPAELSVVVGVQDAAGEDLCEPVTLHRPGQEAIYPVLYGRLDVTGSACAELGAPRPDQRWYVRAADTVLGQGAGVAFGTSLSVGTDQYPVPFQGPIPDGDPDGLTAIIDGSGEAVDPVVPEGGDGPAGEVVANIAITHPYIGDLSVVAGVVDAAGAVTCAVNALEPQPAEMGPGGVAGDIDLSECAAEYPPAAEHRWFVAVSDVALADVGTVDELTLTGPDGQVRESPVALPAEIPDADPVGLVFSWSG